MEDLKIYVGTYSKYNNGSIEGAWLNLLDYSSHEELTRAMRVLHIDEIDPEFMIQDWELPEIIKLLGLIGESYISENLYEAIEQIDNSNYGFEIIESYLKNYGCNSTEISEIIENVEESYQGEYSNDIDFVQSLLEDTGDIPESLPNYIHIDWESTSRDLMMDYFAFDNHYFRNI